MKRKLTILALVVGLIGALLATAGVASGSVPGAKLDLQANDLQGDRFVLIEGGTVTYEQVLTKQGACGVTSSVDELVDISATAIPNNPAPGLKDHILGVTAKGEGNGTPCSRIDGDSSGRGEELIIEFAGPTIGDWYADYAQFGIKLKFGATGVVEAYNGSDLVDSDDFTCAGGDCGPDSGDDRHLFQLEGGNLFNRVIIRVDNPYDGAVSLVDDPDAGYDTYFTLARILGCGDRTEQVGGTTTFEGIFKRLENFDPESDCNLKPYNLNVDGSVLTFDPQGGDDARYSGIISAPEKSSLSQNPTNSTLTYDPELDGTYVAMQWCMSATIVLDENGYEFVTAAELPGSETWCIAAENTVPVGGGDIRTTWTVYGRDDPRFSGA